MTTANPTVAARISQRYGRPERSCSAIATPPSSQASVIRLTISDETSAPSAALKPTRSRTASKTALPDTAATRPHISEKTMIPQTPIGITQKSW